MSHPLTLSTYCLKNARSPSVVFSSDLRRFPTTSSAADDRSNFGGTKTRRLGQVALPEVVGDAQSSSLCVDGNGETGQLVSCGVLVREEDPTAQLRSVDDGRGGEVLR